MQKEELLKLPLFERAIVLAGIKHAGQKDKGGKPYMMHVLRVMMNVEEEKLKIAALLHDLLEDTDLKEQDLLDLAFGEDIVSIVSLLTRKPKEEYVDYIKNIAKDKSAIVVKLSDLKDNQNRARLKEKLTGEDVERLNKYHQAEKYLLDELKNKDSDVL